MEALYDEDARSRFHGGEDGLLEKLKSKMGVGEGQELVGKKNNVLEARQVCCND